MQAALAILLLLAVAARAQNHWECDSAEFLGAWPHLTPLLVIFGQIHSEALVADRDAPFPA